MNDLYQPPQAAIQAEPTRPPRAVVWRAIVAAAWGCLLAALALSNVTLISGDYGSLLGLVLYLQIPVFVVSVVGILTSLRLLPWLGHLLLCGLSVLIAVDCLRRQVLS